MLSGTKLTNPLYFEKEKIWSQKYLTRPRFQKPVVNFRVQMCLQSDGYGFFFYSPLPIHTLFAFLGYFLIEKTETRILPIVLSSLINQLYFIVLFPSSSVVTTICFDLRLLLCQQVIKQELKNRPMYECRCDERLKGKTEGSTLLIYTGFWDWVWSLLFIVNRETERYKENLHVSVGVMKN